MLKGGLVFRCLRILTAVLLVAGLSPYPETPKASAATYLEGPYDYISNLTPNQDSVQHEVGFILPSNLTPIQTTDWIMIDAPGFRNLSAFTDYVGGFGTPIFDTIDNTFRVTHLSLLPGTSLALIGGSATNPVPGGNYNVTIRIVKGRVNGPLAASATVVAGSNSAYNVVSAIVDSPLSGATISGWTAPTAFVSLIESGNVVGTTRAQGDGSFSFSITALAPGDHTFSITSTDGYGLASSQATVQLHLLPSTSTTASGILLSSTIRLDKESISPGDVLTMSGTAKPDSQINIFTESPLRSYIATSDSAGNWLFDLSASETQNYAPGQYRAYTVVQDNGGNQSLNSQTVNFTVVSPVDSDNPAPACDISTGDLNCDHKTNLTDFSILLFHWGTNHKLADINADTHVNLTDFSIMMFYFQF